MLKGKEYSLLETGDPTPAGEPVYLMQPGDMIAFVDDGVGLAVRHNDGKIILFGWGTPGHRAEFNGVRLHWRVP